MPSFLKGLKKDLHWRQPTFLCRQSYTLHFFFEAAISYVPPSQTFSLIQYFLRVSTFSYSEKGLMCTNVELQWNEPTHLQHNRCKPWCWPTEDLYSLDFYLMDVEISMYRESRSISEYCSITKRTFLGEAGVAFQNYSCENSNKYGCSHLFLLHLNSCLHNVEVTSFKQKHSTKNHSCIHPEQ